VSSQNDAVVIGFLADAAAIFDADRVLVLLYDFDRGLASEVAEWVRPGIAPRGLSLHSIPLEKVPADVRQTHRQGEPYWIPDVPAFPEGGAKPGLVSAGIRSALAVPLMDGSECFGFVGFDWTRALHVPEPGEPLRIKLFAAQCVAPGNQPFGFHEKRRRLFQHGIGLGKREKPRLFLA